MKLNQSLLENLKAEIWLYLERFMLKKKIIPVGYEKMKV